VAAAVGAVVVLLGQAAPPLARHLGQVESIWLDWRFHARGPVAPDPRIAIVAIDDASLGAVGRWPWPRKRLADLVRAVEAARPAAIGLDILQAEASDAADDAALAQAFRESGKVYLPMFISGSAVPQWFLAEPAVKRWQEAAVAGEQGKRAAEVLWSVGGLDVPLKELAEAAAGMGTVGLHGSTDGVYREVAPVMRLGERLVPSQPLALAVRVLGVEPKAVNVVLGRYVEYAEQRVAIDELGLMLINYAGPSKTYPHVAAAEVLKRGEAAMKALRGRVVLIGSTAPGLLDLRPSPYDGAAPGVEGLANVTANLLNGDALRRVPPATAVGLALVIVVGVAALMSLLPSAWGWLAALVVLLAYWAASVAGFSQNGLVTPLTLPTLAGVAAAFAGLALRLSRAEHQRSRAVEAFRHFVPPQVAERLADADLATAERGERRLVTVLFADMRNSTVYAQELEPEDFVEALNRFFGEAHGVVWRWEGTLDKFIGDELLAFFNAPAPQEDHALRAVRTGLDLQAMVERQRELWEYHGLSGLGVRVGIATGEVVVGYVGSEERQQYTIIGPAVNLAARLIELGKALGVNLIVSESTYAELGDAVEVRDLGLHRLAGFDLEQGAYEVLGVT
jgi:adenylate cyclase